MKRPRVIGERIYLRPFERTDLTDDYLDWINDLGNAEFILGAGFPVTRDRLEAYYDASAKGEDAVMFAVCDKRTDRHIGNARLSHIDWLHRMCRYGRLLGDPDYMGRGYGSDTLIQLLRFGFHNLGMNRIWSAANADNERSLRSNDRIGMTREGILRDFIWYNGEFRDGVALSMLRRDFDRIHGEPASWREKEMKWLAEERERRRAATTTTGGAA